MPDGLAMTPVDRAQRYLLYGSERYALAILRPVQEAIRARGDEAAWFFDGPGAEDLVAGERLLSVSEVRAWDARAVITPSNAVPHFFPGVKVETFAARLRPVAARAGSAAAKSIAAIRRTCRRRGMEILGTWTGRRVREMRGRVWLISGSDRRRSASLRRYGPPAFRGQ